MRNRAFDQPQLPETFWHSAEVRDALRVRDLRQFFRLLSHDDVGLSQTRLGQAVGLSQGQVSEIIRGARTVSRLDVLERINDLDMPDDCRMLLGLTPRQPRTVTRRPMTAADAGDQLAALVGTERSGFESALATSYEGTEFLAPSRDWLINRANRTNSGDAGHRRDQAPDADAIVDTFGAFQQLDTRHGGAYARSVIVDYLRASVLPQLKNTANETALTPLQAASAQLVYLAGLTAFDSGACGLAQQYFATALGLAGEAEDDAFAANILAAMAHLASTHRDAREAIHLAEAGIVGARRSGDSGVGMRVHIALARGYALDGDTRRSVAEISRAEQALDGATTTAALWGRFLDASYLSGEMAFCFLDLDDPKRAERFAAQSVAANASRDRRLSLSHATLTLAQLRQGSDVDLNNARTGLGIAGRIRSSRSLRAVREVATGMSRIDNAEGRALQTQARQLLLKTPASRCCPLVGMPTTSTSDRARPTR